MLPSHFSLGSSIGCYQLNICTVGSIIITTYHDYNIEVKKRVWVILKAVELYIYTM